MTAHVQRWAVLMCMKSWSRSKEKVTPRQQLIPLQVKGDFLTILSLYSMHISSHSVKHLCQNKLLLWIDKKSFKISISCRLGSSCGHSVSFRLVFLQQYYDNLFFPLFLLHILYTVLDAEQKHLYEERN